MTAPDLSQRLTEIQEMPFSDMRREDVPFLLEQLEAQSLALEEAQRQLTEITRSANAHGWNGVENSKILTTFIEQALTEKEAADTQRAEARQQIAHLETEKAKLRSDYLDVADAVCAQSQDATELAKAASDHRLKLHIASSRLAVLREALNGLLKHYVRLINSGDAGNWDPETDNEVIAARAALLQGEPEPGP